MGNNDLLRRLDDAAGQPQGVEAKINIDTKDEVIRNVKLRNDDLEKASRHRNILVWWMISVVSLWLILTGVIVSLQLAKGILSDTVMCAFLTTTTVNVLGLAVIVLRGLFHKK